MKIASCELNVKQEAMKKFGLNLKVKGQMWHDDKKGLFHAKKKLENKIKNPVYQRIKKKESCLLENKKKESCFYWRIKGNNVFISYFFFLGHIL